KAAAIRETAEKTSVLVADATPAVVEWSAQVNGGRGCMALMFAATMPEAAPAIRIDRDELVAAEWAPRDRAFALLAEAGVRQIVAALESSPATAYLEAP